MKDEIELQDNESLEGFLSFLIEMAEGILDYPHLTAKDRDLAEWANKNLAPAIHEIIDNEHLGEDSTNNLKPNLRRALSAAFIIGSRSSPCESAEEFAYKYLHSERLRELRAARARALDDAILESVDGNAMLLNSYADNMSPGRESVIRLLPSDLLKGEWPSSSTIRTHIKALKKKNRVTLQEKS